VSQFYPEYLPPPRSTEGLRPLIGQDFQTASMHYWQARNACYMKVGLNATEHLLWLLVTLITLGLGIIPWIIFASKGKVVMRPGAVLPPWPPSGYYIPTQQANPPALH